MDPDDDLDEPRLNEPQMILLLDEIEMTVTQDGFMRFDSAALNLRDYRENLHHARDSGPLRGNAEGSGGSRRRRQAAPSPAPAFPAYQNSAPARSQKRTRGGYSYATLAILLALAALLLENYCG